MIAAHEIAGSGPAAVFAAQLQASLPVIETARLRLRAPTIADFADYADIACGPRGAGLGDDGPMGRADAWYDFANMVSAWMLRGHGLWTVEARDGGATLGFVVLGFEPGDHEPELGYMFSAGAEGKGYAHEAAEAARAFAFGKLGFATLVSTIAPDNARSCTLAERLGGTRDARAEAAHGDAIRVYRYRPEEAA